MQFIYQTLLSSPQDNPEPSDQAKLFKVKLMEFQRPSHLPSACSAIGYTTPLRLQACRHFG